MKPKMFLVWSWIVLVGTVVSAHPPDQPAESAERVSPLLVGAVVPTLTLETGDGAEFDLNAALASKPTILIFYRGGW